MSSNAVQCQKIQVDASSCRFLVPSSAVECHIRPQHRSTPGATQPAATVSGLPGQAHAMIRTVSSADDRSNIDDVIAFAPSRGRFVGSLVALPVLGRARLQASPKPCGVLDVRPEWTQRWSVTGRQARRPSGQAHRAWPSRRYWWGQPPRRRVISRPISAPTPARSMAALGLPRLSVHPRPNRRGTSSVCRPCTP